MGEAGLPTEPGAGEAGLPHGTPTGLRRRRRCFVLERRGGSRPPPRNPHRLAAASEMFCSGPRGDGRMIRPETPLSRVLFLDGVDPGESDHHRCDQEEEQQLDPDRQANHSLGLACPRAAPLAVSGARNQLPPARIARDLDLHCLFSMDSPARPLQVASETSRAAARRRSSRNTDLPRRPRGAAEARRLAVGPT